MLNLSIGRARRGAALMAAVVSVFTAACNSDSSGVLGGNQSDKSPPTVQLSPGGTSADTVISFQVEV